MIEKDRKAMIKAIAICFKPFLKPEEAMIYCNLERTRLALRLKEHRIFKTATGYYRKEELDRFMAGETLNYEEVTFLKSGRAK